MDGSTAKILFIVSIAGVSTLLQRTFTTLLTDPSRPLTLCYRTTVTPAVMHKGIVTNSCLNRRTLFVRRLFETK